MAADHRNLGPNAVAWIIAGAIALGAVLWGGSVGFASVDLADVSLRQLGELLATYLFLALLVERAVELILNWRFGVEEIAILTPLKQAAARSNAEMQILARDMEILPNPQDRMALLDGGLMRSAGAARGALPDQAAETRGALDALSLRRRRWATWCSTGLSAGLALSGFQMLHGAFAAQIAPSALPDAQMQLFLIIDFCMTTIVLAGGAGGIHSIISRLLDFNQPSKTGILPD